MALSIHYFLIHIHRASRERLELDSNGLIMWCENGHVYKLESSEHPCDESENVIADETYLLPEDESRIAPGVALGWSEPSRNTLSGRLAGRNPDGCMIDVWPEFCVECMKLLEYRGECDVHPAGILNNPFLMATIT